MQYLVVLGLAWLCIALAQLDVLIDKLLKKSTMDDINLNRRDHNDMSHKDLALQSDNYYAEYTQFDHNSCYGDILFYSSFVTDPRLLDYTCLPNNPVDGNSKRIDISYGSIYPSLPTDVQYPSSTFMLMT